MDVAVSNEEEQAMARRAELEEMESRLNAARQGGLRRFRKVLMKCMLMLSYKGIRECPIVYKLTFL